MATESGHYPCSECGAFLTWNAREVILRCDHCGHKQTPEALGPVPPVSELSLKEALEALSRHVDLPAEVMRCQRCGAEVQFAAGKSHSACTYCGSVRVRVDGAQAPHLTPGGLIPFSIPRDQVLNAFRAWKAEVENVPRKLREVVPALIHGFYVPFWTFDARAKNTYHAFIAEEHETVDTYAVQTGDRVVKRQKLRTFVENKPVEGSFETFTDDLLVTAGVKPEPELLRKVLDFNFEKLKPYRPEYLAGFQTVEYRHSLAEAWKKASTEILKRQRKEVQKHYAGQQLHHLKVDSKLEDLTYKHILLPFWVIAYRFSGRVYHAVMNGQTGTLHVQIPRTYTLYVWIGISVLLGIILLTVCALR